MTLNNDVPPNTVAEFIAYVKANPGKVNLASSGNGTSVHLSGEMFMAMSGAKMQHVPYRGAALALTDLIGGQVQVIFDNMPSVIQHIKSGAVKGIAVTTTTRSELLPDTPTVADTVPGYEASALFGMGAPKNTPKEIITKLNQEINAVLAEPAIKARLIDLGGEPLIGAQEFPAKRQQNRTFKSVIAFGASDFARVVLNLPLSRHSSASPAFSRLC
jgi:tripartite-type tricarboxylate transporter receptor subunit TctC